MNRILIVTLAALLTGCATAPQPKVGVDGVAENSELVIEQGMQSAGNDADQPQQSSLTTETHLQASEITFTPAPRMPVDPKAQQCLAQSLYWEARGEGPQGMLAVAAVILNRVEDERFPDSVCDVAYEGGETAPCQFSWWCDGKSDRPRNQAKWAEINALAHEYLATRPEDPTDGALFYHANSIQNPWRRQLTAQIGNHIFYR